MEQQKIEKQLEIHEMKALQKINKIRKAVKVIQQLDLPIELNFSIK